MTFKCKICGGELDIEEGARICTCQYCGSKQTLPKMGNTNRANLYDRANHFRRQKDFDKASALYETILNEDPSDAEAYWSLVTCKYGIEYVEDPVSGKRVPTCNRTQYTSILADEDYKQALANADDEQKSIYQEEANIIDGIQQNILKISNNEAPYDVFICYKETDQNGERSKESLIGQDIYTELSKAGYKVFFSRITLEDKLGVAYEPYIFAALQSASVMLVLGTKAEHINAVWVKNEWSRYLGLMKNGAKKQLVPAYRDMDPYDLPEEFSHLQALDMSKLGFMQDLLRGIDKILSPHKKPVHKEHVEHAGTGKNIRSLLDRAFIELSDSNWKKADSLLEEVLNNEPTNARAYIGKFMAEWQLSCEEEVVSHERRISENPHFQKALRFADGDYRQYLETLDARNNIEVQLYNKMLSIDAHYKSLVAIAVKENLPFNGNSSWLRVKIKNFRDLEKSFISLSGYDKADEWAKKMGSFADITENLLERTLLTEKKEKNAKRLVRIVNIALFSTAIGLPLVRLLWFYLNQIMSKQ